MSLVKTLSVTKRVLTQLHHDPRTIGLLFVVPSLLLILLKFVFEDQSRAFDQMAPMLLGIFPMTMMFLITSIVTLRERSSGTLDRLMTMPMSKVDFILGYAIAFSLLGLVQATIAGSVMIWLLGVTVAGGAFATIVAAVASAFLGTSLGLFTSAFASSEFQAVQFMPAFIFPQFLTCGLLVARDQMADWLQRISDFFPLTYSVDALKQVTTHSEWTGDLTVDLLIVAAFGVGALLLGSATIRRKL